MADIGQQIHNQKEFQISQYLFLTCLFLQIAALEEQLKDEKSKALQDKEFLVSIHRCEHFQAFHPKWNNS